VTAATYRLNVIDPGVFLELASGRPARIFYWVVADELAHTIAAEGDYMPGPSEWNDMDDLERRVRVAAFFGGGAITYRLTEKGRQWLAASLN
jgi:hypothetical protein